MSEVIHLGDLKPDPKNARKHNPRNIGMIVDSLQKVGGARSIVVDQDLVVLAGNGVIEAAAEAGIERVRVIDADGEEIIAVRRKGLTEEQKRLLALYDNRTAELAEWDVGQVLALADEGMDLSGLWYPEELDALLEQTQEEDGLAAGDGQIKISPELFERQDYLVFYFDNEFDWQVA